MTEPKPIYITVPGQEEPIEVELPEDRGALARCLIGLAKAMGYKDQGHQWAGHRLGHVHLFENAEGRVVRVTPQETVEVWRDE